MLAICTGVAGIDTLVVVGLMKVSPIAPAEVTRALARMTPLGHGPAVGITATDVLARTPFTALVISTVVVAAHVVAGSVVEFDYVLRRNNGYFVYSSVEGVGFQV